MLTARKWKFIRQGGVYEQDGPCGTLKAVGADGVGHDERSRWGSVFDHLEAPATALAPISRGSFGSTSTELLPINDYDYDYDL